MEPFEIFSSEGDGIPSNLPDTLVWLMQSIDDGKVTAREAVEVLCDLVRPGHSEHSHDVKPIWAGAMWALGYGQVAEQVKSMYVNSMPWGVGFAIAVEKDFAFEALSDLAKRACVKAMCIILQIGGLNAEMTDDGQIRIDMGDGEWTDVDTTIGEFRQEIEDTLGPDATPKRDDPMKRWMP